MAHSIYILLDGTMPKASSLTESIKSRLNWLRDELRKSANEYRLAVFSYGAINFNVILPLSDVKEATAPLLFQPQVGFRSLGSALGKIAHIVAKDRKNYPDDTRLLYVVSHGIPIPKLKKTELDEKLLPCGFSKKTVVLLGDITDSAPGEYLPLTPNIYQNQPAELFNNVLSDVGMSIRRSASPILASPIGRKSAVSPKGKAKADSTDSPASPSLPPPILPTLKPKKSKTPPPLPPAVTTDAQRKAPAVSMAETRLLRTQNQALLEKVQDLESQLSAQSSTAASLNGLTARNNELEKQLRSAQAKLAELEKALSASEQNSQARQETEARLADQEKTLSATKKKLSATISENEKLKQQIQEQTNRQKEQVSLLSSQADEIRAAQEQKIAELQTAKQTLEQKVLGQAALQTELEMTKQMWAQTQEFNKSLQDQVETGFRRGLLRDQVVLPGRKQL